MLSFFCEIHLQPVEVGVFFHTLDKVFYELIIFSLDTNEDDFYTQQEIEFIKEVYIDILKL